MNAAAKKTLPKMSPCLSREATAFIRKRRLESRRTLDTNCTSKQEKQQAQQRMNEEQLIRQIASAVKIVDEYKGKLVKKKGEPNELNELRFKQQNIQRLTSEISQLEDEISRLKQIYNRPKGYNPANQYTRQHLKQFTLADQISKQKKHLQLHIDQHAKLKKKAENLHKLIRATLPQYIEHQQKKGFKSMSYGEFKRKALMERKEKERQERKRSISARSSHRSRSASVRSIILGKSEDELIPQKKNMEHLQRRKSVAVRARLSSKKKYDKQKNDLEEQYLFLKEQDGNLNIKIDQLTQQLGLLQASLMSSNMISSRRYSTTNL